MQKLPSNTKSALGEAGQRISVAEMRRDKYVMIHHHIQHSENKDASQSLSKLSRTQKRADGDMGKKSKLVTT